MQLQENLLGISGALPEPVEPVAQSEASRPLNQKRRLIRRCKEVKLYNSRVSQENKSYKLRWLRRRKQNYKQMVNKQDHTQSQTKNNQMNKLNDEKKVIRNLQKIEFDISILTEQMQESYIRKQKLKNTSLMIPGVKFVNELTQNSISKWQKALIIYQKEYFTSKRKYHFGLLLKHLDRLITFDGIRNLWPIQTVEKSFHWEKQDDTWSCGYRALFWIHKIQQIGMDKWVKDFEADSSPSDMQFDY